MVKHLKAELIKLKYPPIIWLIAAVVLSISILIYFAHYNDVESISAIGKNPWIKIWEAAIGIFSIFMNVPFLILLLSAALYIENQSNSWKYQYCAPISRVRILITKLFSILILTITTYVILALLIFIVAYMLSAVFPEIEFRYYPLHFSSFSKKAVLTLINSLGIIGIQFYLSIRFKGFLVPAVLGIIAFIIALIVGVTNTPVSHYFPHAYPLIGQDFNMFTIDKIGIVDFGWLNSVQISSIATFLIFTLLGIYRENKRAV